MCSTVPSVATCARNWVKAFAAPVTEACRAVPHDRVPGASVHEQDLDLRRARLARRVLIRDVGHRRPRHGPVDVIFAGTEGAGRTRQVPDPRALTARHKNPGIADPENLVGVHLPAETGAAAVRRPSPRWITLPLQPATAGDQHDGEPRDVPDDRRSSHVDECYHPRDDVGRSPAGCALVPEPARRDRGGARSRAGSRTPRCACHGGLHVAKRAGSAGGGPFPTHPVHG